MSILTCCRRHASATVPLLPWCCYCFATIVPSPPGRHQCALAIFPLLYFHASVLLLSLLSSRTVDIALPLPCRCFRATAMCRRFLVAAARSKPPFCRYRHCATAAVPPLSFHCYGTVTAVTSLPFRRLLVIFTVPTGSCCSGFLPLLFCRCYFAAVILPLSCNCLSAATAVPLPTLFCLRFCAPETGVLFSVLLKLYRSVRDTAVVPLRDINMNFQNIYDFSIWTNHVLNVYR